jgi:hypothetical protein
LKPFPIKQFLEHGEFLELARGLRVVLGIALPPCDDSPSGHPLISLLFFIIVIISVYKNKQTPPSHQNSLNLCL